MGIRVEGETLGDILEGYAVNGIGTEEEVEQIMLQMPPFGDGIPRESKPSFVREKSRKNRITLHYNLRVFDLPSCEAGVVPFDLWISLLPKDNIVYFDKAGNVLPPEQGGWKTVGGNGLPAHFAGVETNDGRIMHMTSASLKTIILGVMESLCGYVNETVYVTPEEGEK